MLVRIIRDLQGVTPAMFLLVAGIVLVVTQIRMVVFGNQALLLILVVLIPM